MGVVKDAVCTFCGCTCDDIELVTDTNRIIEARHACALGEAWFLNHTAEHHLPDAIIDGRPADLGDAVGAAARILARARYPLIFGLSNATCEAAREAVALAERVGGVIDSHSSI
ncbi:MAG TPA: hypothetical protein VEP50_15280 [bacterium]|nr:hypothetical protein [bacterium]